MSLAFAARRVTLQIVMSIRHPRLKGIVAAIALIVTYSIPLNAQTLEVPGTPAPQAAPEVPADLTSEPELLQRLATADTAEAKRLDRQLQAIWSKSGSASMDLLLQRGRDALEADEASVAIEHLTALTDHAPEFAEGFHTRATAYFRAGLYGPALADLGRALELNPNNYNAIYGLGVMLESLGEDKRAFAAYERVLALNPHHEEAAQGEERLRVGVEGTSL